MFINYTLLIFTSAKRLSRAKRNNMKNTFESFAIGCKVQSFDKDGYFVMSACGYIVDHLGDGHAIIKTFGGAYYSTVSKHNIAEIELLP